MEIIVDHQKKNIFVKIGALRIFGRDKNELKNDEERIARFDRVWANGLSSALEQAINDDIRVHANVVRKRLEKSYRKAVPFLDSNNRHFEFSYNNLLFVAELELLDKSFDKYKLEQLWSFTYSDLPPDMICIRFDSVEDRNRFSKLSEQLEQDAHEVAKDALVQRMKEMINVLEIQQEKLTIEVRQLKERRRQSNIYFYETILDELIERLEDDYPETAGEDSWQAWIYNNNWLFGIQYREPIEKLRVGFHSIPDYIFPTLDGYLDILEIKKPTHYVLQPNTSHPGSYNWSAEVNKAIGQAVNYLHEIELHQLELSQKINREYGNYENELPILAIKPRAFILIGSSSNWTPIEYEAFRKLNYSLHGITVLTYNHLIRNCRNLINLFNKNAN